MSVTPRHARRFFHERTLVTFVTAAALMLLLGAVRHRSGDGLAPNTFWAIKASARGHTDLVVLGDSQVLIGVAPEAMATQLPGARIFNFGFEAANYSEAYLRRAEELLAPNSSRPAILLGVTALTLTVNAEQDGFAYYVETKHWVWMDRYWGRLRNFFLPVTTRDLLNTFPGDYHVTRKARFHLDGWLETSIDPPTRDGLRVYEGIFNPSFRGQVSNEKEQRLLDAVRRWRARGVEVYAFTPPLDPEVDDVIRHKAGWHQPEFIQHFKDAGGRWLTLDSTAYHTYDGVHLESESAKRLSTYLAQKIANARVP